MRAHLAGLFSVKWLKAVGRRRQLAPWLWLLPGFVFIAVFLIYPVVDTIRISLMNANSTAFIGLENYEYVFTNGATQSSLLNNVLGWPCLLFSASVLEYFSLCSPAASAMSG